MIRELAGADYKGDLVRSLDSMEGLFAHHSETPRTSFRDVVILVYPGVLVAGTTGLAASWLAQHYNAPVMLFALLFGVALHFLFEEGRCRWGIEFCSRTVLRVGVALLGARITFNQLVGLGTLPILIVLAGVVTTIAFGILAAKMLSLRWRFGLLSGGAVGICGASAALAIASTLPPSKETERDTVYTVVVVTTLSTVVMILYPVLTTMIGLDHQHAGLFLGGTIHDVAQVVGAGYSISPETGDIATYVKLLRVAMLVPVVLTIGASLRYLSKADAKPRGVKPPLFLLVFVVLVLISSTGLLTESVVGNIFDVSRWCLVTAIAALGMKTSFKDLAAAGWKPAFLIASETAWIACLTLIALLTFG